MHDPIGSPRSPSGGPGPSVVLGVGGGIAVNKQILGGAHGVAGEWGHIPLPGMSPEEMADAPVCYCGKRGCIEVWCSGPA